MSTMSLCHHDYKVAAVILDVSQILPHLPYKRWYFLMHFFLLWRNTFSTGPMSLLTRSRWPGRGHTLMPQLQKSLGTCTSGVFILYNGNWALPLWKECMGVCVSVVGGKELLLAKQAVMSFRMVKLSCNYCYNKIARRI